MLSILLHQDTWHGTPGMPAGDPCPPPWLCPSCMSHCEPAGVCAGIQARPCIPGHDHASLSTASRPSAWLRIPEAATKKALAREEGTRASSCSAPEFLSRDQNPRHVPSPATASRATVVTEGLCWRVTWWGRVLGLLLHHHDCSSPPLTSPASPGGEQGWKGSGAAPDLWQHRAGAAVAPLALSSTSPSFPKLGWEPWGWTWGAGREQAGPWSQSQP